MQRQRTLRSTVETSGIGLHSGESVHLKLCPAPAGHGVVFRRTDLEPVIDIPARVDHVGDTRLSTTLQAGSERVATVEHLLAALSGMGVDNVRVELSAPEVPILDGSARPFVSLIQAAGLQDQPYARQYLRILRKVEVADGDKEVSFLPFDGFKMSFTIDFDQPVLRRHAAHAEMDFSRDNFIDQVSSARTFGFLDELESLRSRGFARGGSLDNAILLDRHRIVNREGLRSPDEFVKHKLLDAMGDLYLLGFSLRGEFRAHKSGHALNNAGLQALLNQPDAWEIVEDEPAVHVAPLWQRVPGV